MKLRSKPISLKYFGLFKFEKIAMRKNKYVRKLVFDGCAKIKFARKLIRIKYSYLQILILLAFFTLIFHQRVKFNDYYSFVFELRLKR